MRSDTREEAADMIDWEKNQFNTGELVMCGIACGICGFFMCMVVDILVW